MVPMEVYLLERLKHPNIIQVLDNIIFRIKIWIQMVEIFEFSTEYYLITERRPQGMDLFHFIDSQPPMDEALASHIFRQVGISR